MDEILKGMRAALLAANLSGISQKIFHDLAPTGTAYPYIVISNISSTQINQDSANLSRDVWQVSLFHTDAAALRTLLSGAKTALHRAPLSYSGLENLWTAVQGKFWRTESDNDTPVFHAGLEIRVITSEP
jgi:hypothetical protein